MTDALKSEGPYGVVSPPNGKAGLITLPLPEDQVDLSTFQIGNNFKAISDSQLLPSDIIDVTPLFWQGKPNAFWFKTHDDRVFNNLKTATILERDDNATLDEVVVGKKQVAAFTASLQAEGDKLKDFIVSELAPVFLCAKNAVWVAQQELRVMTDDPELELSDIEPSYATFLRKAMRFKLASFVCEQLKMPEASILDMLGTEHKTNSDPEIKSMLSKTLSDLVTEIGGSRGKTERSKGPKA